MVFSGLGNLDICYLLLLSQSSTARAGATSASEVGSGMLRRGESFSMKLLPLEGTLGQPPVMMSRLIPTTAAPLTTQTIVTATAW
jgi:hypothetical protein